MTRRRNLVFELVLRRARHFQRIPRFEQTKRRLSDLGGPLGYLQRRAIIPLRHERELYRYFPVALVAIIEGHFKMLYSELIDSGEPFLSNARGFRDVKFDLDSLVGVRQRSVSIGELIAHQLPHSSMSHIDSHMSTLLNQDFEASSKSDFAPRTRLPTTQPFKRTCADFWMSCFGSVTFTVTSLLRNRDRGFFHAATFIKTVHVFLQMVEEHVADYTHRARKTTIRALPSPNSDSQDRAPK